MFTKLNKLLGYYHDDSYKYAEGNYSKERNAHQGAQQKIAADVSAEVQFLINSGHRENVIEYYISRYKKSPSMLFMFPNIVHDDLLDIAERDIIRKHNLYNVMQNQAIEIRRGDGKYLNMPLFIRDDKIIWIDKKGLVCKFKSIINAFVHHYNLSDDTRDIVTVCQNEVLRFVQDYNVSIYKSNTDELFEPWDIVKELI